MSLRQRDRENTNYYCTRVRISDQRIFVTSSRAFDRVCIVPRTVPSLNDFIVWNHAPASLRGRKDVTHSRHSRNGCPGIP